MCPIQRPSDAFFSDSPVNILSHLLYHVCTLVHVLIHSPQTYMFSLDHLRVSIAIMLLHP